MNPFFPPPANSTGAGSTDANANASADAGGAPPAGGMFDQAMLQQVLAALGAGRMRGDAGASAANPFGMGGLGGLGGMGGMGGLGAFGTPPAPADSRPPEERFQVQLEVRKRSVAAVVVVDHAD